MTSRLTSYYRIEFRREGVDGRWELCIGHIQISAAENRAEPHPGILNYSEILPQMEALGYKGAFGCEYRPHATTENGLAWRDNFRRDTR